MLNSAYESFVYRIEPFLLLVEMDPNSGATPAGEAAA